jgi:Protocatechuate 3,4-dioxygenase beta subunit
MDDHLERTITRRGSLLALGGLAAGALGWQVDTARSAGDGPAGIASGAISCVLTPELTEGPYYVSGEKVRRDITEGRPGAPLSLALTVVDASTCKPVKGASVDIWHCDALGVYSGVQGNIGTFMRGVQRTDASGLVRFTTVYPGWYNGRAVPSTSRCTSAATSCTPAVLLRRRTDGRRLQAGAVQLTRRARRP